MGLLMEHSEKCHYISGYLRVPPGLGIRMGISLLF